MAPSYGVPAVTEARTRIVIPDRDDPLKFEYQ
jgi:hypothetical protein